MGKRDRYEPGTFCWVDLATTDPEGAKAFYNELFGWEAEDMPAGEDATYTMMNLDGDYVAGLYEMDDERKSQGVPPYWLSYISVEDAEVAAAKAKELGGKVIEEAFDVVDSGRMSVISDPEGTVVPLWQPKGHIGAGRVNDPGCPSLNQLNTTDPERAAEFYEGLFGWEISQVVEDPPYWGINNKGSLNGGMMVPRNDTPPSWLVYFTTDDFDGAVEKIGDLGGTILVPQTDVPPEGRIAVFTDPQGAAFALFEGRTDE